MAQAEACTFLWVPRKTEKWLKVFVFFLQCVLNTGQYSSRLEQFSKFRVNVIFWEVVVLYDLTMDKHCRRFCFQGEGAEDLLEVLGHSQELKVVNFYECSHIPAVAWQKLRGAKWPQLKKVDFEGCLARKREMVEGVCVFLLAACTWYCTVFISFR